MLKLGTPWVATLAVCIGLHSLSSETVWGQDAEKLKQALAYRPTQKGVEFDLPTTEQIETVRLENASTIGQTGFVVRDSENRLLRRFVDSSGNRKIDTWAYYSSGFEVYRDMDTDADGKPDRFQWLGPNGARIGIDTDQDLTIDRWERISAQELTQVVSEAINANSPARLKPLLASSEEVDSLQLDAGLTRRIKDRIQQTIARIDNEAEKTNWPANVKWLHFSAAVPGSILGGPSSGAANNEPVIEVHDHASAILEVGDKSQQLLVGSLLNIGSVWRMVDFPALAGEAHSATVGGVFFQGEASGTTATASANLSSEGIAPDVLAAYQAAEESLREAIGKRTGPALAVLHQRRAQALWKVVMASQGAEREPWLRQYVDVVTSAYQMDEFPTGLEQLEKQIAEMKTAGFDAGLLAYAEFRHLSAWYSHSAGDSENVDAVQDQWQQKLKDFVAKHPSSLLAAEAMFQLANIDDYLGDVEAATAVYRKIVTDYPEAPMASRAKGAVVRLTSVGKPIAFRGSTLAGQPFSLEKLKGKTVVIHFWATWCEPCKAEFADLQSLHAKYGKDGFEIVSVSVDESKADVEAYLTKNRLPWLHLFEEGGLEGSPLAAQLGVIALPTMIMIDREGKVIERGLSLTQVERELKKLAR
ncbi:MAG: redoxin family protein [Pirellulaceae bacterium]|nr:redoxin family protein [Pirellulaceae bacterium]